MVDGLAVDMNFGRNRRVQVRPLVHARAVVLPEDPIQKGSASVYVA